MKKEDRGHVMRYDMSDVTERLKIIHGERFVQYRKAWDESCEGRVVSEYPLFIEIGVNSDCNLCCKMCARRFDKNINNKHINMSLELVDKIVKQCKEFQLPSILVGQDAECLLHPQIKEIVSRIKSINPVDFFLITNGTLLNKEMSEFLIDSELDRLQISVDAASKETYKKIRGGDLDVLERNIHDFLEIRNAKGTERPFLRLSFCKQPDNMGEQEEFLDKWSGVADIVDFQEYIDLSHTVELAEREYKEYYCPDPFQRLVIDYNGNMYGCCCIGYNRHFLIGNLNDISIIDAWNSDIMNDLRESFRTQNLKMVCLNCRANRGVIAATKL